LNPSTDIKSGGELRLYLKDQIVDIVPHFGRMIIFKSEKVEHEVKPTVGYKRFAITTWYRHIHKSIAKHMEQSPLIEGDGKIFIGIPAYRDPELPLTVRNIIE
jgi:predicted 2-oxoglutarate/Fe(II)-dependent dioxygenase YbiX